MEKLQPTFHENEEKRTIVCSLPIKNKKDLYQEAAKVLGTDYLSTILIAKLLNNNKICVVKELYKCKARCSPEDTWDKALGMEIAYARALDKYYKDIARTMKKMSSVLSKYKASLDDGSNTIDSKRESFDTRYNKEAYAPSVKKTNGVVA